jgi:hypothetical protein
MFRRIESGIHIASGSTVATMASRRAAPLFVGWRWRRVLAVSVVAMMASCGDGDNTGPGNDSGGPDALGVGFTVCGSATCQPGQYCYDSNTSFCSNGCLSNVNCAADQTCDTSSGHTGTCRNKGGDVTPPETCTPTPTFNDECGQMALCLDVSQTDYTHVYKCVETTPCEGSGQCQPGATGAVCNDGYLPAKGKICLPGSCSTTSNCPADSSCLKQQGGILGSCSSGAMGSVCLDDSDCISGLTCTGAFPGTFGFCLP